MNLNRQFLIALLMIVSAIAYGKENLTMMTVSLEKGSISAVIYQGALKKDILVSLKKAHPISEKQAEKSVVIEGIYHNVPTNSLQINFELLNIIFKNRIKFTDFRPKTINNTLYNFKERFFLYYCFSQ